MARRFTESGKWDDSFFLELPPEFKLLWMYICDRCDLAGVWEPSQRLADFHLGTAVDLASARARFSDRVDVLPSGRWRLVKFIGFQYPNGLNPAYRMHKPIIDRLIFHALPVPPFKSQPGAGEVSTETQLSLQDKEQDSLSLDSSSGGGSKGEPRKLTRADFVRWLHRSTLAADTEALIEGWIGVAIKAGAPKDSAGPIDWALRIDCLRRCCALAKQTDGKCRFPSQAEPFAKQVRHSLKPKDAA